MIKTLEQKIDEIVNLDKKRTQGNWEFYYDKFTGQFTSLYNDNNEIVLQATGRNDGDDGLHWIDEELNESDRLLIEKVPEMINIILQLQEENKRLKNKEATISRLNEVVAMQKNLLIELEMELLTKGIGCRKIEEILEKSQKILGE
jgi:DNA-binding protein